jgi:hypothetical protein
MVRRVSKQVDLQVEVDLISSICSEEKNQVLGQAKQG